MDRLLLQTLFIFTMLWSFSAQAVSDTANKSNTVRITSPFEFTSLDPSQQGYLFTRMQVIETLLNVNEQGSLVAGLATQWSINDQGRVWRFELRPNVRFHNGTALTAEGVVNSLRRAQERQGPFNKVPVKDIRVDEQNQVIIELERPYRTLGAVVAHYSTAIIAPAGLDDKGQVTQLVGTGPYQMVSFEPPHAFQVQRFDSYWGQVASIEYATYLTSHRAESRVLQARTGQADVVFNLDPASVMQLKRLPSVQLESLNLPRTLMVKLNSQHPFLNEPNARRALSLAINRVGIAQAILRTPGAETDQLLPASMPLWHLDRELEPSDLTHAKALLGQLGWVADDEGMLVRDGKPFSLRLITYADRPELTTVATALQDQWKQLGIQVSVDITNSSSIPAGHQDGTLEMALIARNYGFIADPLEVIRLDFGSEQGGDWGAMGWDSETQKDIEQMSDVNDPQRYKALAQKVASAIYDERPVIPVAAYTQHVAVQKRVKGFKLDPYERTFYINEWEWAK
ncbi:ABC transporter substrate-binding protein [Neptunomonas phycophila]|uniref:ABC transporter substrate-binding protein n=1 Tax=Neptunomonas phycophila TaxID=1572645 RepID=UPI0015B9F6CD|nr:ABC transporter substrate-binding protein [Neptunomonas phycophila]QLE99034.1 ABC transporter substrate-binding protein [Neptunomonas phycophila]